MAEKVEKSLCQLIDIGVFAPHFSLSRGNRNLSHRGVNKAKS
jgi:hypothetical protein